MEHMDKNAISWKTCPQLQSIAMRLCKTKVTNQGRCFKTKRSAKKTLGMQGLDGNGDTEKDKSWSAVGQNPTCLVTCRFERKDGHKRTLDARWCGVGVLMVHEHRSVQKQRGHSSRSPRKSSWYPRKTFWWSGADFEPRRKRDVFAK